MDRIVMYVLLKRRRLNEEGSQQSRDQTKMFSGRKGKFLFVCTMMVIVWRKRVVMNEIRKAHVRENIILPPRNKSNDEASPFLFFFCS